MSIRRGSSLSDNDEGWSVSCLPAAAVHSVKMQLDCVRQKISERVSRAIVFSPQKCRSEQYIWRLNSNHPIMADQQNCFGNHFRLTEGHLRLGCRNRGDGSERNTCRSCSCCGGCTTWTAPCFDCHADGHCTVPAKWSRENGPSGLQDASRHGAPGPAGPGFQKTALQA